MHSETYYANDSPARTYENHKRLRILELMQRGASTQRT